MPKLKVISGKKIIKILKSFGFIVIGQKGSHIKLSRNTGSGEQEITLPNHSELDKGTTKAIYNQIIRYISEADLFNHFYTK